MWNRRCAELAVILHQLSLGLSYELQDRNITPPIPTAAPRLEDAVLFRRQVTTTAETESNSSLSELPRSREASECGFINQNIYHNLACQTQDVCTVTDGHIGCCGTDGENCGLVTETACVDYNPTSAACVSNSLTSCCAPASPLCHTYVWNTEGLAYEMPVCEQLVFGSSTRLTLFEIATASTTISRTTFPEIETTTTSTTSSSDTSSDTSSSTTTSSSSTSTVPPRTFISQSSPTDSSQLGTGESNENAEAEEEKQTPVGAIVGGVIGGILGLGLILVAIFFFLKRKQEKQAQPYNNAAYTSMGPQSSMSQNLYVANQPSGLSPQQQQQQQQQLYQQTYSSQYGQVAATAGQVGSPSVMSATSYGAEGHVQAQQQQYSPYGQVPVAAPPQAAGNGATGGMETAPYGAGPQYGYSHDGQQQYQPIQPSQGGAAVPNSQGWRPAI